MDCSVFGEEFRCYSYEDFLLTVFGIRSLIYQELIRV